MTYTSSREIGRTIDFVPVEASAAEPLQPH